MIRRPPRSTQSRSSAASDVYKRQILHLVKALPLHVTGTRPLAEATVTRGGVDRRQIDPKTMGSKLCAGLFFAGELIDVDGPCGGYNLQMCFSTGTLAGRAAARQLAGLSYSISPGIRSLRLSLIPI